MDTGLRLLLTALKRSQWTLCRRFCSSYRYWSLVLMFAELLSPSCVWGWNQLKKIQSWQKNVHFLMCLTWHVGLGLYCWQLGGDTGSLASLSESIPFGHLYLPSEVSKKNLDAMNCIEAWDWEGKKKPKQKKNYVAPQYNRSWIVLWP